MKTIKTKTVQKRDTTSSALCFCGSIWCRAIYVRTCVVLVMRLRRDWWVLKSKILNLDCSCSRSRSTRPATPQQVVRYCGWRFAWCLQGTCTASTSGTHGRHESTGQSPIHPRTSKSVVNHQPRHNTQDSRNRKENDIFYPDTEKRRR